MGRELIREEADVWSREWKSSRVQVNMHICTVANLHSSAFTEATMEEECLSGINLSCLLTSSYSSSFLPSSLTAPLLWSRPSPSAHSTALYSPWRPSAKSTCTSISGLLARSGPSIVLLGAGWRVIKLRSGVIALSSLLLLVGMCQGLRFYCPRFSLIDYFQGLFEQCKSRGSVKAARSTSSFGKYVAGIEERVRVTRSVIFLSLYAVILFTALLDEASGHAPRPLGTLIWVLGNAISDSSLPLLISVIGLLESLREWASLHHDDQRGIRPGDLVVSAGSLHGVVWRFKATGWDKMVQSRPIVIPPMSNVHDSGWLLDGRDLLVDFCTSLRGFLLPTSVGGAFFVPEGCN